MKAGAALLGLLWLAASAFAGYRLTERSFAWVDLPDFGLPPLALPTPAAAVQAGLQAAQKNAPSAIQQQLSRLTPPQLACLQASTFRPRALPPWLAQALKTGEIA